MNQIINKNLLYYPIRFFRGENLPYHISKYKRTQFYEREIIENVQLLLLKRLIAYSIQNVKFYRDKFASQGLCSADLKILADLEKFPFLTRDEWMRHSTEIRSDKKFLILRKKVTGGSTSQPAICYKNAASTCAEDAAFWRNLSWYGIQPGHKQARFWGIANSNKQRLKNGLIDLVMNRERISAFNFSKESLLNHYKKLFKFSPEYFYGYTSLIIEFTKTILEKELDPKKLKIKCIITTAEPLSEQQQAFLAEAYAAPIVNDYGSSEIGPIAFMCPNGKMHIMDENLIVEIIGDNDRQTDAGEIGEIVITELNNLSMPMIRYRTRDYGSLSNQICECGRNLKVINEIIGRDLNFLQSTDGTLVHAMFLYYIIEDMVAAGFGNIQVQAIQNEPNTIILNIVENNLYQNNAVTHLIEKLKTRLGTRMNFEIRYVKELMRERSGKLFITKNNLSQNIHNIRAEPSIN